MMNYLVQEGNAASPRTFITEIARRAEKNEEALMTIAEALKQEGIQEGIQKGKLEGIQKGIQKGLEKGLEKGRREGIIAVAKNMLDSGTSQTLIRQVTGLTDYALNNLKN